MSLKESIKSDKDFNMKYNILDDFTGADFTLSKESYNNIFHWLNNCFAYDRKSAVLTNTPKQVANILIFDSLNNNQLPNDIKIFSTLSAALYWIGIPKEHMYEVEAVIEELKDMQILPGIESGDLSRAEQVKG